MANRPVNLADFRLPWSIY